MRSLTRQYRHIPFLGWRCSISFLVVTFAGGLQLPPPSLVQPIRRCIRSSRICHQMADTLPSAEKMDDGISGPENHIDVDLEPSSKIQHEHVQDSDDILHTKGINATEEESDSNEAKTIAKKRNGMPAARKFWGISISPRHQSAAPVSLFPWAFWMKIRSAIPVIHHDVENGSSSKSNNSKHKAKRRWEVPLTSKPFQGVDELGSTIRLCIGAIALYFAIGTLVFPLWLEPSWSFIDSLYFSMVSLTTVGYGDVVISRGNGTRALVAKIFVLLFNIYAVCISVSALGIIAKLALAQEKKVIIRAKERAKQRLIEMFDSDQDDEESLEEEEEEEEDDEQCKWADRVIDEKNVCDIPDEPRSIFGAFKQALQSNLFNFVVLAFIAIMLQKVEGWSLIDVLYYWNCTATTIGFGDVCPQTQLGRLLAIAFIPLSVVTMGEVIASVFAYVNSRIAARAEKDFLRREITLSDLEYLDVNDDGKVCELDFITFMLVAMQKVDRKTMKDLQRIFHALDAGKDGYLQKEDLIELRQRKRQSKRLKREARKKERWFDARLTKTKAGRKWFGWSF